MTNIYILIELITIVVYIYIQYTHLRYYGEGWSGTQLVCHGHHVSWPLGPGPFLLTPIALFDPFACHHFMKIPIYGYPGNPGIPDFQAHKNPAWYRWFPTIGCSISIFTHKAEIARSKTQQQQHLQLCRSQSLDCWMDVGSVSRHAPSVIIRWGMQKSIHLNPFVHIIIYDLTWQWLSIQHHIMQL